MDVFSSIAANALPVPLCRGFLVVLFDEKLVQIRERDDLKFNGVVVYALGVLPDGQCEVLGVWPESPRPGMWGQIFDDLRLRGVEQIRFLGVSIQSSMDSSDASYLWSGSKPLEALPKCHRAVLQIAENGRQQLRQVATRAVNRHGDFSSLLDAAAFISKILERADRRLRTEVAIDDTSVHMAATRRRKPASAAVQGL